MSLAGAYRRLQEYDKALACYERAMVSYEQPGDMYGVASVFDGMQEIYALRGDWRNMLAARSRGLSALPETARNSTLYADLLAHWSPSHAWAGIYAEAAQGIRTSLKLWRNAGQLHLSDPCEIWLSWSVCNGATKKPIGILLNRLKITLTADCPSRINGEYRPGGRLDALARSPIVFGTAAAGAWAGRGPCTRRRRPADGASVPNPRPPAATARRGPRGRCGASRPGRRLRRQRSGPR
jgi:tetratricopeptide (TPR) repeat protein